MDFKKEVKETAKYIIIGLTLAFMINITLSYVLGAEKPVMAVVSNSMEPTFSKGDLIVVKGIDPKDLKEGDIIVFTNLRTKNDIVHRIIDIKEKNGERYFYTKGDHNPSSDQVSGISPPVKEDWIMGKKILTIPYLGWLKVLLTEFSGKL